MPTVPGSTPTYDALPVATRIAAEQYYYLKSAGESPPSMNGADEEKYYSILRQLNNEVQQPGHVLDPLREALAVSLAPQADSAKLDMLNRMISRMESKIKGNGDARSSSSHSSHITDGNSRGADGWAK